MFLSAAPQQPRSLPSCCLEFAGYFTALPGLMARLSSSDVAAMKKELLCIFTAMSVVNERLDVGCTSMLRGSDLRIADSALRPLSGICQSILSREQVSLEEALVLICDTRLCELLLSLVTRLPWAEMQQESAVSQQGLALLRKLLSLLCAFLHVKTRVRSSQQAAVYEEMGKRCLPCAWRCACAACLWLAPTGACGQSVQCAPSAPGQQ